MAKTIDDVAEWMGAVLPARPAELHIAIHDGDEVRYICVHPDGSVTGADSVQISIREALHEQRRRQAWIGGR